jgi:membrane associated rhomboid family serine protease
LIAANVCGFVYELSLPGPFLARFLEIFSFVPARMWSGEYRPLESLLTIFTAMFLHGGWLHILGNMLFLYIFGDNVEDRLGHFRYFVFYLACGVAGSLCHAFFNPGSNLPSLGASGAISGVMGAFFFLYPRARILTLVPFFLFFTVEIPAFFFIFYWFAIQFFSGAVSVAGRHEGGTAYFAHIGGFVAGVVLLAIMKPPALRARPAW